MRLLVHSAVLAGWLVELVELADGGILAPTETYRRGLGAATAEDSGRGLVACRED